MNERRFRLDFLIAIGALLISTVAALASVYQSRVVARQFSATVWPYLSFDVTNSPSSVSLDIRNDGLGSAIVRWVAITLNGKPEASVESVIAELTHAHASAAKAPRHILRNVRITTSTPTAGLVIPANGSQPVVSIEGAAGVARFRPSLARFNVALCYCSLTGSCWTQSYRNRAGEPTSVRSCT